MVVSVVRSPRQSRRFLVAAVSAATATTVVTVVTNIDYEHIDYYKSMDIKEVFTEFLKKNLNDKVSSKLMMFTMQKKMFNKDFNIYLGKNLYKYL